MRAHLVQELCAVGFEYLDEIRAEGVFPGETNLNLVRFDIFDDLLPARESPFHRADFLGGTILHIITPPPSTREVLFLCQQSIMIEASPFSLSIRLVSQRPVYI